ncbi:MAG: glycosyltransferase [Candidatus Omnitrophica bacterium]|nr:glycosyltransferase [Candidatus Omnitrophota bacterium]
MKVSFIIPVYNNANTLSNTVESILKQKTNQALEIIIIDDGSTDNPAERLAKLFSENKNIKLFRQKNKGEAAALNAALAHCEGEFVALIESDVELEEGWLTKVTREFDCPSIMGVGGHLVTAQDDSWIARIAGYEIELKFKNKPHCTKHITSANAIYRKEAFNKIGRFNENLLNAALDADFNSRIINCGYKLIYVENALAIHHFKSTLLGFLKRQYAYARYRVFLPKAELYPLDRWFLLNTLLTGMCILTLAIRPLTIFILFLFLLLTLQIGFACILLKIKKDPAIILYPLISILRNIVVVFGISIGLINKTKAYLTVKA